MLILAAISIATLTGENGILVRADQAQKRTVHGAVYEQLKLEAAEYVTQLKTGEYQGTLISYLLKNNIVEQKEGIEGYVVKMSELMTDKQLYGNGTDGKKDVYRLETAEATKGEEYDLIYYDEKEEPNNIGKLLAGGTSTVAGGAEGETGGPGTGGGGGGSKVTPGEIVTGENKEHTNNGTAVIPVGFAIVPGLDDVSQGLVISDEPNDTEIDKNSIVANGNQFVWIPVDKATFETRFKRTEGYFQGRLSSEMSTNGEADGTGENVKYEESSTTKQEAIDMYASVKRNGGFYIGRYEAGTQDGKVVCKKGVTAYNNITWGKSIRGESEGAVYESRKFAEDNGYTSVVSTLCYGVQWDAALNFIDPNYITNEVEGKPNCQDGSYVKDSTGRGNYNEDANKNEWKGSPTETGKLPEYAEKNIYDMAGNLTEWTMEYHAYGIRSTRGGDFKYEGFDYPVSDRGFAYESLSIEETIGFRPTLYVKS